MSEDPDLLVEAGRTADRLRVVGPRLAARSGPEAAALLDAVRGELQALADAGCDAEGVARRPVPVLGAHALGDQLLVLARDLAATADPATRTRAAARLRSLRQTV